MMQQTVSRKRALMPVAVLLLSWLYLVLGVTRSLNIYDEGLIVYGAERVLAGDVPYRDFWTVYSPGQFYTLAAIFRLFGVSVMMARIYDTVMRALLVLVMFLLARKLAPPALAWGAWILTLLWVGYYEFYGYPTFVALMLSTALPLFLLKAFEQRSNTSGARKGWMLVAGLSAGFTTAYRHDFGAYAMVAGVAIVSVWALGRGALERTGPAPRLRAVIATLLPFVGGAATVLLPGAILLLAAVPVEVLVSDLLVFPATVFPRMRALPYPPIAPDIGAAFAGHVSWGAFIGGAKHWLPFYLPLVAYGVAAVVVLARLLSRKRAVDRATLGMAYLVLFAVASFNQARVRADLVHLVQLLVPSFVVLAKLLGDTWRHRRKVGVAALVLTLPLALLATEAPIVERGRLLETGGAEAPAYAHGIERARHTPLETEQAQLIQYIRKVVPRGERIYVGNGRHDRVFVNEVLLYFLADRGSATIYHENHPGLTTTKKVQAAIVRDLEEYGVRCLVLSTRFDNVREPNESAESSGVTVLDDYIRSCFKPEREFGPHYTVWTRR